MGVMVTSLTRLGDSTGAATDLAEFRSLAARTALVAEDARASDDAARLDELVAITAARWAYVAGTTSGATRGASAGPLADAVDSAWSEQARVTRAYQRGDATFGELLAASQTLDTATSRLMAEVAASSESETSGLRTLLEVGAFAVFAGIGMVFVATLRTAKRRRLSDPLTGLPSVDTLRRRIGTALKRRTDSGALSEPLAVFVVDIDRFKRVNDTLGLQVGDLLLEDVATQIGAARSGPYTLLRRGSEFLLLQEQCERECAMEVALAVSAAVGRFEYEWGEVQLNATIGVSVAPDDADDADTLLHHANSARDSAKLSGGGMFRFYEGPREHLVDGVLALEAELSRGLERDEFELHYQPLMDIGSGELWGAEALLRWTSPSRGAVPPDRIVPLLEETGMIVPVGEWALSNACRQARLWRATIARHFNVSVNVSARQLVAEEFVTEVADVLEETGLQASALQIEITETAAIRNPEGVSNILRGLDSLGVTAALDDFGTGSSSLTHLRQLRTRSIKIDKSFVAGLERGDDDRGIVQGVIAVAHALGRTVTAEGVETREQMAALREMECDKAQGYLIGEPMPAAEFEELLRNWETVPRLVPARDGDERSAVDSDSRNAARTGSDPA
jgi:diguanylate cyclase (GGDEF)-like protein